MNVIGHRGAAGLAVENTLTAIRAALAARVWGVEVDLRLSADGIFYLSHDDSIRPADGKPVKISQSHSRTLDSLRLTGNEKLATVSSAIDLVCRTDTQTKLFLDLKGKGWGKALCSFLQQIPVQQQQRLIVSSFNLKELRDVQRRLPQMQYCYLYHTVPRGLHLLTARKLDAWGVGISAHSFNRLLIRAARNLGLHIIVFTVNSPRKARKLEHAHVEYIYSDFPDRFAILNQ